jgi:hypothetical protein
MATWIFQGNPDHFDVDKTLSDRDNVTWSVNQFADEIGVGDEVFIWRAVGKVPGEPGIVARGTVVSEPIEMPADTPEFWHVPVPQDELRTRVELAEVRLTPEAGMITHATIEEDEILKTLPVFTDATQTNVMLGEDEAARIVDLWSG